MCTAVIKPSSFWRNRSRHRLRRGLPRAQLQRTRYETFDHPDPGAPRCGPDRVVVVDQSGDAVREGCVVPPRQGGGCQGPRAGRIIPVIDQLVKVSLRIVTMPIQSQGIITRDNVSVDISAVAYFRVVDAVKSVIAI